MKRHKKTHKHLTSSVTVTRKGEAYAVVALDLFGDVVCDRVYSFGSAENRQSWAIRQAEEWADRLYLYFDGIIHEA